MTTKAPSLDPQAQGSSEDEGSASTARRILERPPAEGRRSWAFAVPVLTRRTDGVAADALLFARVAAARTAGDAAEECRASRELAERLGARGTELDVATVLARRSLELEEDPDLRRNLATWLEWLGDVTGAARALGPLVEASTPVDAARLCVRIAVLRARGGDAASAQEALHAAANWDQTDGLAFELLGALAASHGNDDDAELRASRTTARGSAAYVKAAERRSAVGDPDAQLEDLLRAFDLDAGSELVAGALVEAFDARGRRSCSDEVLRVHAQRLTGGTLARRVVHGRRRGRALADGDVALALAAALDAGLDAQLDGDDADVMDDLLAQAGAFEALAARLGRRAAALTGPEAARRWAELGRCASGPLASPERALEAYARSVAADPTYGDALRELAALSSRAGTHTWLIEALVRATLGGPSRDVPVPREGRAVAARELAKVAGELGDDALCGFAYAELATLDPADERAAALASRFAGAVLARRGEVREALRRVEAEEGRGSDFAGLARLLSGLPEESFHEARVLEDVAAHEGSDEAFLAALRVADRVADLDAIVRMCRARLAREPGSWRARIELAAALEAKGETTAAAVEHATLLASPSPWARSVGWVAAAVAGDRGTRARALVTVGATCGARVGASLAIVAAEELAECGDLEAARSAAEAACRADANHPRVLSSFASLVADADPSVAAAALERAVVASFPRSAACAKLADWAAGAGHADRALAWTRRLVALRPGDAGALRHLAERAGRAGDVAAIVDVFAWLLPQPQPAEPLAELLALLIDALGPIDPAACVDACHRAVDAVGANNEALFRAIERASMAAAEPSLRAKLHERRIAAQGAQIDRGAELLRLGAVYDELADAERELDAYARAARAGAEMGAVRGRLAALAHVEKSKDGELAALEARTALARGDGERALVGRLLREFGAGLWDWAGDRSNAEGAWLAAAGACGARGHRALRVDLTTFGGARFAEARLAEWCDSERDDARAGLFAVEASRVAMELGAFPRAWTYARKALERSPGHAEALEVAEVAAVRCGRVREMAGLYDHVARGARGRFGRRAAHHRAARYFEGEGLLMLGLKHAAQAFLAVPSEGTTLALLERVAHRAHRPSVAARTVEHVADLARDPAVRVRWLARAVELAGKDAEGQRQRFELLLKAIAIAPSPGLIHEVSAVTRELRHLSPEDGETVALRLEHASDELRKKVEGPDGARMGLAFAAVAVDPFENVAWAWRAIEQAFEADADVEEYANLAVHAHGLATHPAAEDATARMLAAAERPYANVGHSLFRLLAAIARHRGDALTTARALVHAAMREPDDHELVAEADAAVVAVGSEELAARLAKKVGVYRRSESLRAVSARLVEQGEFDAAVDKLERAVSIAPGELRCELESDLGEALALAGRDEEAALRSLDAAGLSARERAERWTTLARVREGQGDLSGITDALLQAATEDPTAERWGAVEQAAEACGREHIRIEALEKLVAYAAGSEKLALRKRLARAEGTRGSLAAAEAMWRQISEDAPDDGDADSALEGLLVARAGYSELAEHLALRAERLAREPEASATRRAVRLRRVAILEQRLGRLEDAARELDRLLVDSPGNESALRWLADLHERLGHHTKTVTVLDELVEHATDPEEREALEVRRVRAMLGAGELPRAIDAVTELARRPFDEVSVLEVRVDTARASGDAAELGAALALLARRSPKDVVARSEMLVEAAQAAARAGDDVAARELAREGATLAPNVASVQLFACGLEYRSRGAGTRDEAKATILALAHIRRDMVLAPEDVALSAFLFAEAEEVLVPGRGEATLRACVERTGHHPLLALGLAERDARAGREREALAGYLEALQGNLLGLRSEGVVALAASELASRQGERAMVEALLARAANDPETRDEALRRLGSGQVKAQSREPASVEPAARDEATPLASEANGEAPFAQDRVTPIVAVDPASGNRPANSKLHNARSCLDRGERGPAEALLFEAAREGSVEAVDLLDTLVAEDGARGAELLAVRRRGLDLEPGNMERLAKVRDAAQLDQNAQLFHAIEHVMRAFDPESESVVPPPLGAQSAQPGMLTLLSRHSLEAAGEALGLVWESAPGLFVKASSTYAMTGLERVVPGPMSALSRLYETTLRLLDTPKFALYHRHPADEVPSTTVALLAHPSAILTCDAREDSPSVRWHMGEALARVLPENVLLFGLPEVEARSLLQALRAAFGPPGRPIDRTQAHLAESLWQTLPSRAQRRLQDLFGAADEVPYELVVERAKQSGRRTGMFLTGDFAYAARRVVAESEAHDVRELDEAGGLARLCGELPALADLFRLAVMPEYADARWRKAPPTSMRTPVGRTSPV